MHAMPCQTRCSLREDRDKLGFGRRQSPSGCLPSKRHITLQCEQAQEAAQACACRAKQWPWGCAPRIQKTGLQWRPLAVWFGDPLNQPSYTASTAVAYQTDWKRAPVLTARESFTRSGWNKASELWKLGRMNVSSTRNARCSSGDHLAGDSSGAPQTAVLKWVIMSEGSLKANMRFLWRSLTRTKRFRCICVKADQLIRGLHGRLKESF